MVAQADAHANGLIQKTKAAMLLNGSLLPCQALNGGYNDKPPALLQLNDATTVAVLDGEGRDVIALAAVLRYSPTQAYCLLAEVDEQLQRKAVDIEALNSIWRDAVGGDHIGLKFVHVKDDEDTDRSQLPLYIQAHIRPKLRYPLEHIVDAVTEKALGVKNLELKKNITIDLYGNYDSALWRDRVGFCVTDRNEYVELTIDTAVLRKQLANVDISGVKLRELNADTLQHLLDYDHTVSQMNRNEYLSFLTSLNGVTGAIAYDAADQPTGYALALGANLLQCYAESEGAAAALVLHLAKTVGQSLTLNTASNSWLGKELKSVATNKRAVHRFHTRAVPTQVKWDKVFALNVGMHLL